MPPDKGCPENVQPRRHFSPDTAGHLPAALGRVRVGFLTTETFSTQPQHSDQHQDVRCKQRAVIQSAGHTQTSPAVPVLSPSLSPACAPSRMPAPVPHLTLMSRAMTSGHLFAPGVGRGPSPQHWALQLLQPSSCPFIICPLLWRSSPGQVGVAAPAGADHGDSWDLGCLDSPGSVTLGRSVRLLTCETRRMAVPMSPGLGDLQDARMD